MLLGYYAASYLDLVGLQYVTAQLGRMILYLYPTIVVIWTAVQMRKRPSRRTLFALGLAYLGVLAIFSHDFRVFGDETLRGSFFIVLCAVCFAAYLVLSKPLIEQVGTGLYTSIALLVASAAIVTHYTVTVFAGVADFDALHTLSSRAIWICFAIAIFCTVIPTFLTSMALKLVGSSSTSIASMSGPAFTSLIAVLVLQETFTIYHLAGIALIVFGISRLERR